MPAISPCVLGRYGAENMIRSSSPSPSLSIRNGENGFETSITKRRVPPAVWWSPPASRILPSFDRASCRMIPGMGTFPITSMCSKSVTSTMVTPSAPATNAKDFCSDSKVPLDCGRLTNTVFAAIS